MYTVITDIYGVDTHTQSEIIETMTLGGTTYDLVDRLSMLPRYEVVRHWPFDRRSRYYSDLEVAQNEWFRQTQEAIGYENAFNPAFTPENEHQQNGFVYRDHYEASQRVVQEEMYA